VTLAWWAVTRPTVGNRVPPAHRNIPDAAQTVIPPVGDAWVSSAQPGLGLGGTLVLRTASRPVTRSYLTFSVAGVSGPITRATLRLWSVRADAQGVAIHAVHGSWDEESITAANAPAIGAAASKTGPIAGRVWASADVTRLVHGNGLVSFALTQVGSGNAEFGSREGAHSPELLVETQLTRYPYLTDVAGRNATVNFGTDQSNDSAVVTWGRVGAESCTAHTTMATKTSVMVNGVGEYQWKVLMSPLRPDTAYCYRPYFGTSQVDLLGTDPSPRFLTQLPAGSDKPFSFAVIGDWGQAYANGNRDQAGIMKQIAASGARFVLGTGDTGYPAGSQTSYGDLQQSGPNVSTVFGPRFWTVVGKSVPMFNSIGNHAPTSTFLTEWPADVVTASSGGQYQMESYCCVGGIAAKDYGTGWYAFDEGGARFYILDAAWDPANLGTGSQYRDDYGTHWAPGAQHDESTWLRNDLAAHPGQLKFAIFHYPLHSDQSSQPSDSYLDGPGHLEGLLNRYHVAIAFNGHAHIYQRNTAPPGGVISYVTGGGGAALMKIGGAGCARTDAYGIGWDPSSGTGSKCGSAPKPASATQVYHFLLVTVNGNTVTVRPTDAAGRSFDVQTYTFRPSAHTGELDTTHMEKNWEPPP
jgi:Calcineurin-like phosphoesterase